MKKKKTLLFSNITGALSVKTIGSRLSIPEKKDVEQDEAARMRKIMGLPDAK